MRPAWIAAAAAFTLTSTAFAIDIRHDRNPPDYVVSELDFPALGSIYRVEQGYRDCVVTLIHPRWLITAAHCTEDPQFESEISAGTREIEMADGRKVRADRLVRHPGGEEFGRTPDIALIRLVEPIEDVEPIPVYRYDDELERVLQLPGWGGLGNGLEGYSAASDGLLRMAENRVDAARDNFLIMRFDDPRSGTGRALAFEGTSGPGDSGNPGLIMTPHGYRVAGIGSATRNFGREPEGLYGSEDYFIRVSDFAEWIDSHIVSEAS